MDEQRAAEVERRVLDAWRDTVAAADGTRHPNVRLNRFDLLRRINPALLAGLPPPLGQQGGPEDQQQPSSEEPSVAGPKPTSDELWEWLFITPTPHGCLAVLDEVAADDAGNQKVPDLNSDAWNNTTDPTLMKVSIFRSLAPMQSQATPPSLCDVSVMVKRVNQAILTAESHTHHYCGFIANILGLALRRCIQEHDQVKSFFNESLRSSDTDRVTRALRVLSSPQVVIVEEHKSIVLQLILHHHDETVRTMAIRLLAKFFYHDPSTIDLIVKVLSEVLEHDPSSKVRCSVFLCVNETVESEPHIGMLKMILAGMEDKDPAVATEATLSMKDMVEVHHNSSELKQISTQLLQRLTKLIMWDVEAKSLVALCVDCIVDHLATSAPHISSLPQELQSLINAQIQIGTDKKKKKKPRNQPHLEEFIEESFEAQGNTKKGPSTLRQAAASCIEEICRSASHFMAELLTLINERLSHEVSWQTRESGIFMLGIIGEVGTDVEVGSYEAYVEALKTVWPSTEFIFECLADPEAKIRAISTWALERLLLVHRLPMAKDNTLYDKAKEMHYVNALADHLLSESHPIALEANLTCVIDLIENGYVNAETGDDFKMKLIKNCVALYPRLSNDNLRALALDFLSTWFENVEGAYLIPQALSAVMPLIEGLQPNTTPDITYLAIVDSIRSFIIGGKKYFRPHVESTCKLLKREISWLMDRLSHLNSIKKDEEELSDVEEKNLFLTSDSLTACIAAVSELLERNHDILSIIPGADLISVTTAILKMNDVRAPNMQTQAVALLGDLAQYAREDLTAIPTDIKQQILEFILYASTQANSNIPLVNNALWGLGKLALYAPSIIEEEWVKMFTSKLDESIRYELLQDMAAETAIQTVFQLGRHFASSVSHELARKAITVYRYEWSFDNAQEKADEVLGWANLARHLAPVAGEGDKGDEAGRIIFPVQAVRSCLTLLHMAVNVSPRFIVHGSVHNSESDDESEHDDDKSKAEINEEERAALEPGVKDAVRSVFETLVNKNNLGTITPELVSSVVWPYVQLFGDDSFAKLITAMETLLSPEHHLVQLFRAAMNPENLSPNVNIEFTFEL